MLVLGVADNLINQCLSLADGAGGQSAHSHVGLAGIGAAVLYHLFIV